MHGKHRCWWAFDGKYGGCLDFHHKPGLVWSGQMNRCFLTCGGSSASLSLDFLKHCTGLVALERMKGMSVHVVWTCHDPRHSALAIPHFLSQIRRVRGSLQGDNTFLEQVWWANRGLRADFTDQPSSSAVLWLQLYFKDSRVWTRASGLRLHPPPRCLPFPYLLQDAVSFLDTQPSQFVRVLVGYFCACGMCVHCMCGLCVWCVYGVVCRVCVCVCTVCVGFPGSTSDKEPACQCRRRKRCGFDPWIGKIPWRRHNNPLQYSCLENSMNRGAWWATVCGVAQRVGTIDRLTLSQLQPFPL